eukprot:143162_1
MLVLSWLIVALFANIKLTNAIRCNYVDVDFPVPMNICSYVEFWQNAGLYNPNFKSYSYECTANGNGVIRKTFYDRNCDPDDLRFTDSVTHLYDFNCSQNKSNQCDTVNITTHPGPNTSPSYYWTNIYFTDQCNNTGSSISCNGRKSGYSWDLNVTTWPNNSCQQNNVFSTARFYYEPHENNGGTYRYTCSYPNKIETTSAPQEIDNTSALDTFFEDFNMNWIGPIVAVFLFLCCCVCICCLSRRNKAK